MLISVSVSVCVGLSQCTIFWMCLHVLIVSGHSGVGVLVRASQPMTNIVSLIKAMLYTFNCIFYGDKLILKFDNIVSGLSG